MKKEQIIWFSGVWTLIGTVPASLFLSTLLRHSFLRSLAPPLIALVVFAPWLIVFVRNVLDLIISRKEDFNPFHKSEENSYQKTKAISGKIPPQYLSPDPSGIVIGRAGRSWVRIPISAGSDGQIVLVSAAMGSGKTTGIYDQTLLASSMPKSDRTTSYIVLDCKPDIMPITTDIDDSRTFFVSPTIPVANGWDAFAGLSSDSSDDQVIERLDRIATALIPEETYGASIWVDGARNALKGLLLYFFRSGRWLDPDTNDIQSGYGDAMYQIAGGHVIEWMRKAVADKQLISKHPMISQYLSGLISQPEETLGGQLAQMRAKLSIFANENTREFFGSSPLRSKMLASPKILDETQGVKLYIGLRIHELEEYGAVVRLIISQILSYLERRPEGRNHIVLLLDELPRFGKIEALIPFMGIARSKSVSCVLTAQNFAQLRRIYGERMADEIYEAAQNKVILSADDQLGEKISKMAGEYTDRSISWEQNRLSGIANMVGTQREDRRKVVMPSDLASLREKRQAMLILGGRYAGICRASRYYEDHEMSRLADVFRQKNREFIDDLGVADREKK